MESIARNGWHEGVAPVPGTHHRQPREGPMRIGLIAPPWLPVPPPAYGGTESVIDRLASGLARAGHDVLLAAAANSSCPVPQVPGTDEARDDAPACGNPVTELRHVITGY